MLARSRDPVWLGAVAFVLLGVGCATGSKATSGPPPTSGRIVQVTPSDAGRTVTLQIGDTLRVLLGPPLGAPSPQWQVRDYPKDLLELRPVSDSLNRFDFVAIAAGTGQVRLVQRVRCGSPGPLAAPLAAGVQCPVLAGGGSSPGTGGAMPERLFEFTVKVSD